MEPWLKYNYYCSFRSVLHVYKMKKDVFEAYFIYTKWKTSLWSILHLYKVRKPVLETFFIVTNKKTFFRSDLRIYKMKKNTFLKHASSVQNDKYVLESFYISCDEKNTFTNRFACLGRKQILHFWSVFHFVRMENMFSKRFACLQNRKNTCVKRFYLHRVETWFGNIFPLSKITKTRFWSIFHV